MHCNTFQWIILHCMLFDMIPKEMTRYDFIRYNKIPCDHTVFYDRNLISLKDKV